MDDQAFLGGWCKGCEWGEGGILTIDILLGPYLAQGQK